MVIIIIIGMVCTSPSFLRSRLYEKWAIENVNKLKFHHDMINNDTKYLEDDHEHA